MNLLTTSNPKTQKGLSQGYLTSILHLAPSTLSGFNTCPMASDGCKNSCLNTAGRGGIFKRGETTNPIQEARISRTRFFFENRRAFMAQLVKECEAYIRKAGRLKLETGPGKPSQILPAFRLNGTSDIRWENTAVMRNGRPYRNIFTAFPEARFYDYTKLPNRQTGVENYSLTFSLSECNGSDAIHAIANGMNLAMVFHKALPLEFWAGPHRLPVIDGDETDLRFLDPSPCIVGLRAKGRARQDRSGFVYSASETNVRIASRFGIAVNQ